MVDPDKAKEKFEKMATSITASTGEEEENACEGNIIDRTATQTTYGSGGKIKSTEIANIATGGNQVKKMVNKTSIGKTGFQGTQAEFDKKYGINSSYDPLSNKGILEVSEKLLKKNFNLGEEGYDIARDEGRVKPSKDKKDATSYPPTEEMKKTQKVNKGPSALEIVKKKYGKAVMDVNKKKKDKK